MSTVIGSVNLGKYKALSLLRLETWFRHIDTFHWEVTTTATFVVVYKTTVHIPGGRLTIEKVGDNRTLPAIDKLNLHVRWTKIRRS